MVTCANCGTASPSTFRFCPVCGHPLGQTEAAPTSPAEPRTERKVVTVLFADLVGFTARSDQADPEDVRALIRPFHQVAKEEIERHGGTLDKFIGDAAMGVFGSPAAHEDDPERAVRAGLAILGRVEALEPGPGGSPLAVRIGIETGEAAVTLAAGVQLGENVVGDVVNTASRIQGAAPVGGVLVGGSTRRATKDAVRYEALAPIAAKGKAEPVPVWRAISIRALPTISERAAETAFVGRVDELGRLREALGRTIETRSATLVTVLGEPGVGKSRLVAELRAQIPEMASATRVAWRRGRCLPYGEGITFWAFGEIVKEEAGILDSDPAAERDRKLALVVERLGVPSDEAAWLRARLGPVAGGEPGPPVEREEAFAAWLRFLEAVAAPGALVAVVEDVHWADPALLDFLEHVADHASDDPILLVATARPEMAERAEAWGARPNARTISLGPLSETETARLVGDLLDRTGLPPDAEALLRERSGGNPLYAEEFVRALRDRGIDGDGRLVDDLGALRFPGSVQTLISARLDALAPGGKDAVHDASVIGRVFWTGAVAYLAEADEGVTADRLATVARRELIRPAEPSTVAGQAEYLFWHALIRDVAYGQIPRASRSRKHRRAARWIEEMAGESVGDVAEILAHHATSALDLAVAAGETDLEDLRRTAARYLRLAAIRTMSVDVGKAEAQLARALELSAADDPHRPRVLATLAEAAFHAGRLDEADRRYAEAVEGLRAVGALVEMGDAMARRSVVLEYHGQMAGGRALLAKAVDVLSQLPPGPELARALATSAGSGMVEGRLEESIALADRAIAVAEAVGEAAAAARAHGFRGYARSIRGDAGGIQEQRDAYRTLVALGAARPAAIVANNLGSALIHVEGNEAALEVFRQGVAFAAARGLREMELGLRDTMLTVLFEVGRWDEVRSTGEEVVREARRQGAGYDEVYAETDLSMVRAYREGGAARPYCDQVLDRARVLEDPPMLLHALVAAGVARLDDGDVHGASDLVREALALTAGDGVLTRAAELPELVRLAVGTGDHDLARRLLEGTDDLELERYRLAAATGRAVLAEAAGDLEAALDGYRIAGERWARWGHALERAHAAFGAARCLHALGRSEGSAAAREVARSAFEALGAIPSIAALERLGVP